MSFISFILFLSLKNCFYNSSNPFHHFQRMFGKHKFLDQNGRMVHVAVSCYHFQNFWVVQFVKQLVHLFICQIHPICMSAYRFQIPAQVLFSSVFHIRRSSGSPAKSDPRFLPAMIIPMNFFSKRKESTIR